MGRIYYAPLEDMSVTNDADQDLFELGAGSANPCVLHGFEIYSAAIAAEDLELRLVRRSTTGNGTAVTEVKANPDDAANTAAVEKLATTPGTIGDIIMPFRWEQLGPLVFLPIPEMRIVVEPSGFLCLNIQSALAATTSMAGWLCWEEI